MGWYGAPAFVGLDVLGIQQRRCWVPASVSRTFLGSKKDGVGVLPVSFRRMRGSKRDVFEGSRGSPLRSSGRFKGPKGVVVRGPGGPYFVV